MVRVEEYEELKDKLKMDINILLEHFKFELICDKTFSRIHDCVYDYLMKLKLEGIVRDVVVCDKNNWKVVVTNFLDIFVYINIRNCNILETNTYIKYHKDLIEEFYDFI